MLGGERISWIPNVLPGINLGVGTLVVEVIRDYWNCCKGFPRGGHHKDL